VSRGGVRVPKFSQARAKQASGLYRSLEGALGRAYRFSLTAGYIPAEVWQNSDGEFSVHDAADALGDGWRRVAAVKAEGAAA
jgi:hypothetical protein